VNLTIWSQRCCPYNLKVSLQLFSHNVASKHNYVVTNVIKHKWTEASLVNERSGIDPDLWEHSCDSALIFWDQKNFDLSSFSHASHSLLFVHKMVASTSCWITIRVTGIWHCYGIVIVLTFIWKYVNWHQCHHSGRPANFRCPALDLQLTGDHLCG